MFEPPNENVEEVLLALQSGRWNFIWNKNCFYQVLAAYQRNQISIEVVCSVCALRSLIDDLEELEQPYGQINTLVAYPVFSKFNDMNMAAIAYLRQSLRVGNNQLVSEKTFTQFLLKIREFTPFEQLFFCVTLREFEVWPAMLQILDQYGRFFRPISLEAEEWLIVPSFSMREALLHEVFGEKNICYPVPMFGSGNMGTFLNVGAKGGHLIGYNFPNYKTMREADHVFTGKYFFTEHDWSHVEEGSLILSSHRKLFSKLNDLYYQKIFGLQNTGVAEYRIFSFGDAEFQICKVLHEMGLNLNDHENFSLIMIIILEVLAIPVCGHLTTFEMLSLKKVLVKHEQENSVISVASDKLKIFEDSWVNDIDVFIKKLLTFFVVYKDELIAQYNFDPDKLDFDIKNEETFRLFSIAHEKTACFKELPLNQAKYIAKKFKKYLAICKNKLNEILRKNGLDEHALLKRHDSEKIINQWHDPMPEYSFKAFSVENLIFYVNKGLSFRVSFLD